MLPPRQYLRYSIAAVCVGHLNGDFIFSALTHVKGDAHC